MAIRYAELPLPGEKPQSWVYVNPRHVVSFEGLEVGETMRARGVDAPGGGGKTEIVLVDGRTYTIDLGVGMTLERLEQAFTFKEGS